MQVLSRLIQNIGPKYPRRALNDEKLLLFWSRYFERCGIG